MNTFYEHHQNSIRFGYRCFDRILLNGGIQPFQQPERVVGFFGTYRNQYPVSRDRLRDIAQQFHNWVKNRAAKRDIPILDAPEGRRDEFVELLPPRSKLGPDLRSPVSLLPLLRSPLSQPTPRAGPAPARGR